MKARRASTDGKAGESSATINRRVGPSVRCQIRGFAATAGLAGGENSADAAGAYPIPPLAPWLHFRRGQPGRRAGEQHGTASLSGPTW
jgi:hypothetical protein